MNIYCVPLGSNSEKHFQKYGINGFNTAKLKEEAEEKLETKNFTKGSRKDIMSVSDRMDSSTVISHLEGRDESTDGVKYALQEVLTELSQLTNNESLYFSTEFPQYSLNPGDVLLFYTGDEEYTYSAKVSDVKKLPAVTELMLSEDFDETVVSIEDITEISVSGQYMSEVGNWDVNYLISFTKIPESGINTIIEDFNSVDQFLTKAASAGVV